MAGSAPGNFAHNAATASGSRVLAWRHLQSGRLSGAHGKTASPAVCEAQGPGAVAIPIHRRLGRDERLARRDHGAGSGFERRNAGILERGEHGRRKSGPSRRRWRTG